MRRPVATRRPPAGRPAAARRARLDHLAPPGSRRADPSRGWRWRVALVAVLGALSAGCGDGAPTEPTPVCTTTLAPANASYGPDGGTGSVTVTTPAGCAWTAAAGSAWIAISGSTSGTGPGAVTYSVGANPSAETRTATVSVSGQVHTVTQLGRPVAACSVALVPDRAQIGKDAATGTFTVSAPAGCRWSAASGASWLTVTSGAQGTGDGSVGYAAMRNVDPAERTGTIVVADRSFSLTQSGDTGVCAYSVAPVTVNACMPAGTFIASVTTQANCPWTATVDAAWLTIRAGASGAGSGTITVQYSENYEAPRNATVLVRWPTPTAGQNVHLAQAGCRYAVTRTAVAFTAAGGTGTFDVLQQSDPTECGGALQDRCVWTPVASDPWIVLSSTTPRSGDNPVFFSVTPNDSPVARVGTIAVRDKTVLITQSGR